MVPGLRVTVRAWPPGQQAIEDTSAMTRQIILSRRNLLLSLPAVLSVPTGALAAVEPTPSQTAGPFYPRRCRKTATRIW